MKSINKCIESKDWKTLAAITHKQIRYKKNKEGLKKESDLIGYKADNALKIRQENKNFKYKCEVR